MGRHRQDLEFYECTLDDRIAFITADLALYDKAPQAERPIAVRFTFPLMEPKANGLPLREESSQLYALEDKLEELLWSKCQAVLAGKFFSAGLRKVFFYAASEDGLAEIVSSFRKDIAPRELKWATWEDPEWEAYLEMLYPNPLGFQYISDRHLVETLEQEGDSLTTPREILHWIYFTDEASAQQYCSSREAEGFRKIILERSEADGERPWMLEISRVDRVDMASVVKFTQHLWISADQLGGEYDGWECQVTKES